MTRGAANEKTRTSNDNKAQKTSIVTIIIHLAQWEIYHNDTNVIIKSRSNHQRALYSFMPANVYDLRGRYGFLTARGHDSRPDAKRRVDNHDRGLMQGT